MKNMIKFYEKGSIEIVQGEIRHVFPKHSHESFCIGIILEGAVEVCINEKKKKLDKNMFFINPSNTSISLKADPIYKYIVICIKGDLRNIFNNMDYDDYYFKVDTIDKVIEKCTNFINNGGEKIFIEYLYSLITKNIHTTKNTNEKTEDEIIENVCLYIKNNAEQKFNLEKLAEDMYISKYYLSHIFKQKMGITLMQYHYQQKIRIIKKQIFARRNETDLSMELNFSDQSHLCKIFKKQMGITCRQYRNNSKINKQ